MTTTSRSAERTVSSDLRRAISRQAWLGNRARNALQRPAFIGAISIGTFVTALVSLVVVPRAQRQGPPKIAVIARPDTLSVVASAAMARMRFAQAESTLAVARAEAARVVSAAKTDTTTSSASSVSRDSLDARARELDRLLARAEQAPLPSSYRALAQLPELSGDARVRALVDSLGDIEREREGFGAVGGVDPIFVALTSRANEIGRTLRSIADEKRGAMRAELSGLPASVSVAPAPTIDTVAPAIQRDSARLAFQQASDSLTRLRARAQQIDRDEEQARERATAVAPPLAMLASAFVLSAVIGFAAALIGELRRPRVSDASELERFLGLRVLSTVETAMPSIDRGRREADRAAPPYLDPGAEAYQLAYLGLATDHPAVLSATITGDDPVIAAVVACNLAAVAADEARNTLLIDLDPSCSASAALRARVSPGIVDIASGKVGWPDARIAARVGRDKSVDLVPFGLTAASARMQELRDLLHRDAARLSRYYDAVFALSPWEDAANGLPTGLPSPDVVYCARPGLTPLRELREQLEAIRASGGVLRGVVLWNAEHPILPTPRELTHRANRRSTKPEVALATT